MFTNYQTGFKTIEKQDQVVTKVYKTTDHSKFRLLEGNRVPNPKHIANIKKAMESIGVLCNPIIVNEKYEIIDGQHRFHAAKELGKPIFYIILEGYNLAHVHALNMNQKNWSKKQYMESYADLGIESYVKLREFTKQYPSVPFSALVNIVAGRLSSGGGSPNISSAFLKGEFKITEKSLSFAIQVLEALNLISDDYTFKYKSGLVSAFAYMFKYKSKEFSMREFLKKLNMQRSKFVQCGTTSQYKEMIEEIYNYRRQNKVNLRF